MKKHTFPLVFAFIAFLLSASCGLFPEPQPLPEEEEAAEEAPPARTYYTLRFTDSVDYDDDTIGIGVGSASVSAGAGRALSRENAVAFHEFFEAVFVYNDGGTYRVARAAWNIGEVPELRGVHRPNPDANYNYGGIGRNPATGSGSALLFVGTRDDKTLLGLGRLVEVDDTQGEPAAMNITTTTRSVTFEVAPITAGVRTTAAASSFRTGPANTTSWAAMQDTTNIDDRIYIHYNYRRLIPLFRLGANTVYGKYNFTVSSTGAAIPANQDFDLYKAGIVLAGGSKNLEMRNPRYFVTEGQYNYSSMFVQDIITQSFFENNHNTAPNGTFQNPVEFRFSNVPGDGSVFAIVFEIFVCNLTTDPAVADGPDAERWRISPGIGARKLDLDDGAGGEGGAIFLGSGDVYEWLENRPK